MRSLVLSLFVSCLVLLEPAAAAARELPLPQGKGAYGGFLAPTLRSDEFGVHIRGTVLLRPGPSEDPIAAGAQLGLSLTLWDRLEAGVNGWGLWASSGSIIGPIEGWVRAGPFYPGAGRTGFAVAAFAEYAAATPTFSDSTFYPSTVTAGPIAGWLKDRVEAHLSLAYQMGDDPAAGARYHGAQAGAGLWVRVVSHFALGGEALARTGCVAALDCSQSAYVALGLRVFDQHGVGASGAGVLGWGPGAARAMAAVRASWSIGPHFVPSPRDPHVPPLGIQEWVDARWAAQQAAAQAAERERRPSPQLPEGVWQDPGPVLPGGLPPRCDPPITYQWARSCLAAGWRSEDLAPPHGRAWPPITNPPPPPPPVGPVVGPPTLRPPGVPGIAAGPGPRVPPRAGPRSGGGQRLPVAGGVEFDLAEPAEETVGRPGQGPVPAARPPLPRPPQARAGTAYRVEPPTTPGGPSTMVPVPEPEGPQCALPVAPGEAMRPGPPGSITYVDHKTGVLMRTAPPVAEHVAPPTPTATARPGSARGGAGPVRKGAQGQEDYAREVKARGDEVVGQEVTLRTPKGDRRVDVIERDPKTGELTATEVKTGPKARLRRDQREKDGEIDDGRAVGVGARAERAGVAGPVKLKTKVVRRP